MGGSLSLIPDVEVNSTRRSRLEEKGARPFLALRPQRFVLQTGGADGGQTGSRSQEERVERRSCRG